MIKAALCDDEPKILEDLSAKIAEAFETAGSKINLFKTEDPLELLNYLKNEPVNVLFLDIDMPKISGMDIAKALSESDRKPLLIFVTSHDALVYRSFQYHPFGFIRKTHFDEEILGVVQSVVDELDKSSGLFSFRMNDGLYRIKRKDILYFESESNYLNIHTPEKTYKFRSTLSSVEEELSSKGFIRTHKGFLVNQEHIYSIRSEELVLSNHEVLPIGRSNRESVKAQIMRYMR